MDVETAARVSADELGPETPLDVALATWLQTIGKGESGRYREEGRRVVGGFLADRAGRGAAVVADLDGTHLRRYAEHLARRAWARESNPEQGITGRTAHQYFAQVRAFCTYLTERDALDTNPAKLVTVTDELPDRDVGVHSGTDQQFWSPATREAIVRWVDWRADDAIESGWLDPARATRDRALVAVLAYSGARGAEVFADPRNDRRVGLRWRDVDIDAGELRVLGKSQEMETAVLLEPGIVRLRAHRRRLDPPTPDWPLFVTGHLPSLYGALSEAGVDAEPTKETIHDLLREYGVTPPALSVNGARTILKRLSAESGITQDGDALLPHGARRGLGDQLYSESAELAQEVLRHQSVETTHAAYRDRDTGRTRSQAESVLREQTD